MVTSVVGHMSVATEYFRMILEYPMSNYLNSLYIPAAVG